MATTLEQKLGLSIIRSHEKDLSTLGDFSVPILLEPKGCEPYLLGSGWFLQVGAEWFLVTAGHVLQRFFPEGVDPMTVKNESHIIVPDSADQAIRLTGSATITPEYDVGVLRLYEPELVRDRWKPINRMLFVADDDFAHGGYFVPGWPGEIAFTTSSGMTTKRYQLLAPFGSLDVPFDRETDIRLSIDKNDHQTLDGRPVPVTALEGMSGAPIWRVFQDGLSVYRPQLAGIQTGFIDYDDDKWIIHGIRCGVLRNLVEKEAPGLYAASERLIAPW